MLKDAFASGNAVIPYFTYADPSESFTRKAVAAAFEAGADVVELGVPFSDPIADGPVIQASHNRALAQNPDLSLDDVFRFVKEMTDRYQKPIVLMMSVNLVFRYGVDRYFKHAAAAGLAGSIIPDLAVEEAQPYIKSAKSNGQNLIFLVSPVCSAQRLPKVVAASTGFVYLIAAKGTTGERKSVSTDLSGLVRRIKSVKDIPVAVGFGISSPAHVKTVHSFADGAIVGSHLVRMIGENSQASALKKISDAVRSFVES